MAPHVEAFDASRLDHAIQQQPNGRRRKPPVDLQDCALKELLQYECDLNGPRNDPRTKVVCEPVLRLFRQYVCFSSSSLLRRASQASGIGSFWVYLLLIRDVMGVDVRRA
nr:hypothetical protein CFP56_50796 [Quercus suber]